ncbi:MAG: hypothetical protein JSW37_02480, partial [Anaerolineales bacterium]
MGRSAVCCTRSARVRSRWGKQPRPNAYESIYQEVERVKTEEIIEAIEKLSVLDLVELKKALEERWGVTA